jgi:PAP2 superfamily
VFQRWWHGRFGRLFALELMLVVALYQGYRLVRALTREQYSVAFRHADEVVHLERLLGLASEDDLQWWVLRLRPLLWVLNRYYAYGHFLPTVILLLWLYASRGAVYRRVRNALAATTLMALMLHVAYPLAPPRMMPGFVDTMARFGPEIYESGRVASAANQIAAMPSLHFAWALLVAWAIVMTVRHPMCWVVLAHPMMMLLAIVATANHWWVDAAVAGALVLLATRVEAARLPVPLRSVQSATVVSGRRGRLTDTCDAASTQPFDGDEPTEPAHCGRPRRVLAGCAAEPWLVRRSLRAEAPGRPWSGAGHLDPERKAKDDPDDSTAP